MRNRTYGSGQRKYLIVPRSFLVIFVILITIVVSGYTFSFTAPTWRRPVMEIPDDNPLTDASIELGGALFFETLLSRDSSLSCQSCHLLTDAFADHLPVGMGVDNRTVTRNTPTLINIGYSPYFMADGKFATLEEQVLGPINDHREFDMSPEEVVDRLRGVLRYDELSDKAYNQELSIEVIQKALANFQRAMVFDNSKFDRYMRGEVDLSAAELNGWSLFKSEKLNCIACHSGFNFTNYAFENNGFFENYGDSGRYMISGNHEDIGKFKVPTLRNVAITYPYMHDGSVLSLEEIIDSYADGGNRSITQSDLISGFALSAEERNDLVAFLHTLTDNRFLESAY